MNKMAALEPLAWLHKDDSERVISDIQKSGAERDGGASASSVRPFSIPLGCLSLIEAYAAAKVREAPEEAARICDAQSNEWDSESLITAKDYAEFCAVSIRKLIK